jgi:hypothetical protein
MSRLEALGLLKIKWLSRLERQKTGQICPVSAIIPQNFKELSEGRKPASFFNITYDPS